MLVLVLSLRLKSEGDGERVMMFFSARIFLDRHYRYFRHFGIKKFNFGTHFFCLLLIFSQFHLIWIFFLNFWPKCSTHLFFGGGRGGSQKIINHFRPILSSFQAIYNNFFLSFLTKFVSAQLFFHKKSFICVILMLYTKFQSPTMPGTCQKVCVVGVVWWVDAVSGCVSLF